MSTIAVDNIRPSAGGTSVDLFASVSTAWVNYYQQTPAVQDSYNLSSVSDDATGIFTLNYSSTFGDGNYNPNFAFIGRTTTDQANRCMFIRGGGGTDYGDTNDKSTSSMQMVYGDGATEVDANENNVSIRGSLA